jgi:predicted site-specific integrase-resolvase
MEPHQPPPPAVSQTKAADLFGVSDRTIRRWEKDGLITGRRVKKGGKKFYPYEQLRRLVWDGEPEARPASQD